MLPRVPLLVVLAGLTISGSGCMAGQPVRRPVNQRTGQVELTFATPREIEARSRAGARVVLPDLRGVRGRAVELRGDTLVLAIAWWRTSSVWQLESPPVVATLRVSELGAPLTERRVSALRTAGLIVLPPVLLFAFAMIVCSAGGCSS